MLLDRVIYPSLFKVTWGLWKSWKKLLKCNRMHQWLQNDTIPLPNYDQWWTQHSEGLWALGGFYPSVHYLLFISLIWWECSLILLFRRPPKSRTQKLSLSNVTKLICGRAWAPTSSCHCRSQWPNSHAFVLLPSESQGYSGTFLPFRPMAIILNPADYHKPPQAK